MNQKLAAGIIAAAVLVGGVVRFTTQPTITHVVCDSRLPDGTQIRADVEVVNGAVVEACAAFAAKAIRQ